MNEYKLTTTIGDLFVTAPSRKHVATIAREDPRFDGVRIKKIARHKARAVCGPKATIKMRNNRSMFYQLGSETFGIDGEKIHDGR